MAGSSSGLPHLFLPVRSSGLSRPFPPDGGSTNSSFPSGQTIMLAASVCLRRTEWPFEPLLGPSIIDTVQLCRTRSLVRVRVSRARSSGGLCATQSALTSTGGGCLDVGCSIVVVSAARGPAFHVFPDRRRRAAAGYPLDARHADHCRMRFRLMHVSCSR